MRPLLTAGLDMMAKRLRDYWRGGGSLAQVIAPPTIPVWSPRSVWKPCVTSYA
ncbi:hypothetical protein ACIHCQ_32580 [Streptomyces sp. NPDC052236]|uniref:hypothetical protein n=1 Tax=Streptomyces sp. NPDC052236 TaxID=3365686 RepID=UPI0037D96341